MRKYSELKDNLRAEALWIAIDSHACSRRSRTRKRNARGFGRNRSDPKSAEDNTTLIHTLRRTRTTHVSPADGGCSMQLLSTRRHSVRLLGLYRRANPLTLWRNRLDGRVDQFELAISCSVSGGRLQKCSEYVANRGGQSLPGIFSLDQTQCSVDLSR